MATIKFFIQSKNNPAGIYVRLKEGRNIDAKAKTKYLINPENWSSIKGQPKNLKDAVSKQLNQNLEDLKNDLLSHYNSTKNQQINTRWLKDFLNPPIPSEKEGIPNSLLEYFEYYIKHQNNLVKATTINKVKVVFQMLVRFQESRKKTIALKDVGLDFRLDFETYCLEEGYAKGTVNRAMKYIKTVCYHAERNGEEINKQLKGMVFRNPLVPKIYLNIDEIKKIEETEIKQEYLQNARDWLIISIETGQRISDFMDFKKHKIVEYDNRKYLEFRQQKIEARIITIPISSKVLQILEKHEGNFPRKISDVNYNLYIKEVCKKAGLTDMVYGTKINPLTKKNHSGMFPKYELVTAHIGRRSFATNNYGIIPTPLLMNATGHTSETTFLIYIGKTPTEKATLLAQYIK